MGYIKGSKQKHPLVNDETENRDTDRQRGPKTDWNILKEILPLGPGDRMANEVPVEKVRKTIFDHAEAENILIQ